MNALRMALRVAAAAGLAVDAYVHLKLAHQYSAVASTTISEGTLFRIEGAAAIVAALLVLVWRHRLGDGFAWLTAAAGLAAIVFYRYIDPGALGPVPDMYEPIWFNDKVLALAGQALALAALTPLIIGGRLRRRHVSRRSRQHADEAAAHHPSVHDHPGA
ncbi:hypothetical protein [Streptacidiphilus jiangxiensis]|uniref:Uncharacterized protein n=1 Tax=Streptacidiphilus jiangxiensis TaxID=235985 RepID=A0A1H7H7P1_STRJI|nr:hypothetical protein [Streptacidiphilus jiangxiensis]SEK45312.1 hypothetical protein SAMN05414137_10278 [Streptacidiphilus jiangxiensis]